MNFFRVIILMSPVWGWRYQRTELAATFQRKTNFYRIAITNKTRCFDINDEGFINLGHTTVPCLLRYVTLPLTTRDRNGTLAKKGYCL